MHFILIYALFNLLEKPHLLFVFSKYTEEYVFTVNDRGLSRFVTLITLAYY